MIPEFLLRLAAVPGPSVACFNRQGHFAQQSKANIFNKAVPGPRHELNSTQLKVRPPPPPKVFPVWLYHSVYLAARSVEMVEDPFTFRLYWTKALIVYIATHIYIVDLLPGLATLFAIKLLFIQLTTPQHPQCPSPCWDSIPSPSLVWGYQQRLLQSPRLYVPLRPPRRQSIASDREGNYLWREGSLMNMRGNPVS
jgi:hypothetical protein